jgi:hypothetical protein
VEPDSNALSRQRTSTGAVLLIGLGALLLAHEYISGPLHNPIMLGIVACFFGVLYNFGGARLRWAGVPALFFAVLAPFSAFSVEPWHLFGFGVSLWPLLLVALGVWAIRRERRLA